MRFFVFLFLATSLAFACSVTANVGSDYTPDGGMDLRTDGAASPDGSSPEGEAGDGGVGCGISFAQEANFVDVEVKDLPEPSYAGGTIVAGTYELVRMHVYTVGATGTMRVRETLVVRGSSTAGAFERLIEGRDAIGSFQNIPLHGRTQTWERGVSSILFSSTKCPNNTQEVGDFEASGTTLVIHESLRNIERTYRRIR